MPDEFEQNLKELTADLKRILTNRAVVLKGAYERDIVYYKAMITTHEVTIGQQSIQLKKAQEVVEDNVQTILRLQAEVDSLLEQNERLYSLVPDGAMDIPDSVPLDVQGGTPLHVGFTHSMEHSEPLWHNPDILQCEICSDSEPFVPVATIPTDEYSVYLANKATGRGMVEYPFNPEGEKEPYPYTHPIREIPDYSKVKVKK